MIGNAIESKSLQKLNELYSTAVENERRQRDMIRKIKALGEIETTHRILASVGSHTGSLNTIRANVGQKATKMEETLTEVKASFGLFAKGFTFKTHLAEDKSSDEKSSETNPGVGESLSNLLSALFTDASSLVGKFKNSFDDEKESPNRDNSQDYDASGSTGGNSKKNENPFASLTGVFDDFFNKLKNMTNNTNFTQIGEQTKNGSKSVGKFIGAIFGGFVNGASNGFSEGYDHGKEQKEAGGFKNEERNNADGYDLRQLEMKELGVHLAPWTLHSATVLKNYFPLNEHLATFELNRLMISEPKHAAEVIKEFYGCKSKDPIAKDLSHFFGKFDQLEKTGNAEADYLRQFKITFDKACKEFLDLGK